MTPPLPHEEMIEHQLAELTTWHGAEPELWRTALEETANDSGKPAVLIGRFLTWPVRKLIAASLLIVLIGVVITALLLPSNGRTRTEASMAVQSAAPASSSGAIDRFVGRGFRRGEMEHRFAETDQSDFKRTLLSPLNSWGQNGAENAGTNPEGATQSSGDRSVIRKATIELTTDDVRSTFLKAMHLVSEAGGEYIQDSELTGAGKEAQANLTLRVSIDRLSAVLNDLRNLGKVRAEAVNGEDVTAQVVDLEARLRNEQRVEAELLQLLEKRNDAPLKEILELRTNIAQVRQTIEQINAQREKLSHLVALATVLVIIKAENAPPPPPEEKKQTIGQYFGHAISTDWHEGLRVLADTLAGAVKLLIGGLVWWVALIAGLLILRQYLRRRAALAGV
jgi:hypothetical protein